MLVFCNLASVELVFVIMAASEFRQATYSKTGNSGMCSTDAPYSAKNANKRNCAMECLHLATCEDFNHKNDNSECALFLHKPLFYDSIPGCGGYKVCFDLYSCDSDDDCKQLVTWLCLYGLAHVYLSGQWLKCKIRGGGTLHSG